MACCMTAGGSYSITSIGNSDIARQLQQNNQTYNQQMTQVNEKLRTIETQLCVWGKPVYGDAGESAEKNFWQAALIAVATLNTLAQIDIMQDRYRIAKDYANIAKDRWNRFQNAYAPLERAMLFEIMNTAIYDPDYPRARAAGYTNARSAFAVATTETAEQAKKYAICLDRSQTNDLYIAEAIASDDGTNYNYRDEEFYAHLKNDLRWNRRSALLNLGRDLNAQSASYASAANNLLAGLGALAAEGAGSAAQLLGYLSEQRNTQYPAQFSGASPLTENASSVGSSIAFGPIAG